ncbi:predicted protein [Aspergillus nidulans FGSC A4]|uniref:Uncharacterized protein n=1 Tax=Emericella nidulans (strain FGSC A4 / ATCC 38163 / CBS 112.46 / NRRL 194 / M139) TaxID=227321 RepID=Q5AV51_EMENI|nr:hypothetical protein [Aspergillus nidulans FGSC A4]EAA61617.1 predicted protein [Aspergillus nidulans FGSC A4]CBF80193.1 TPA: hypothetical protein ANIA_07829 [Aspergillus nidulans FGSC A4]|eukprot:XP_681098.1 predicted protein [Aspergillus nidulans FGSC A4]
MIQPVSWRKYKQAINKGKAGNNWDNSKGLDNMTKPVLPCNKKEKIHCEGSKAAKAAVYVGVKIRPDLLPYNKACILPRANCELHLTKQSSSCSMTTSYLEDADSSSIIRYITIACRLPQSTDKIHVKLGEIVRIGTNELSFTRTPLVRVGEIGLDTQLSFLFREHHLMFLMPYLIPKILQPVFLNNFK